MEPKPQPAPRLKDRKRAAILEAAAEEFQSQGYLSTSMDRVAARAGVSKRTVYNHFPSKEDLFRAIAEQVWCQAMEVTDLAYDPEIPLDRQLTQIGTMKLKLVRQPEYLQMTRAVMGECLRTPERAREVFHSIWNDEDALAQWMRKAMADGKIEKVDPRFAAEQFWGLVKYPVFLPLLLELMPGLTDRELRTVVKNAVEMFLARYGLPRKDRAASG